MCVQFVLRVIIWIRYRFVLSINYLIPWIAGCIIVYGARTMILARCVRHSGSQLDHLPRIILSACHLSRARWIIAVNAASQTFATNVNNSIPSHKHQLDNPHHTNASLNAMLSTACCAKPSQPAPNATKNSPSSHRERYAIVPPISSLIMAPASALREPNNMRISALCVRLRTVLLVMR